MRIKRLEENIRGRMMNMLSKTIGLDEILARTQEELATTTHQLAEKERPLLLIVSNKTNTHSFDL